MGRGLATGVIAVMMLVARLLVGGGGALAAPGATVRAEVAHHPAPSRSLRVAAPGAVRATRTVTTDAALAVAAVHVEEPPRVIALAPVLRPAVAVVHRAPPTAGARAPPR